MKRQWILRGAAGVVLFLLLAGPTPGNVGGCGSEVPVAQARQHCTDTEYWKCIRDQAAGRIMTADELNECMRNIEGTCSGAEWPAGCAPTPQQSMDCIFLLRRSDLISIPYEELQTMYDDCNLCM